MLILVRFRQNWRIQCYSENWSFNCKLHRNRLVSLILLRFAHLQCLAATHLSSTEVGNGLSWPKPQRTCNAMVTSQAPLSTKSQEGVLLYAVIQHTQCWWATTSGCRDEESNLGPPGSNKSTLPLGNCHYPSSTTVAYHRVVNYSIIGQSLTWSFLCFDHLWFSAWNIIPDPHHDIDAFQT